MQRALRASPGAFAAVVLTAAAALTPAWPATALAGTGHGVLAAPATPRVTAYGPIAFPRPGVGVLVQAGAGGGGGATVLRTTDNGAVWVPVMRLAAPVEGLAFPTAADGWLWTEGRCGNPGCIGTAYVTRDAGLHWRRVAGALPARSDALAPTAASTVYALGRGPACAALACPADVWRSGDGGAVWRRVAPPDGLRVQSVAASGRGVVLLAGMVCAGALDCRPELVRSTDGGARWHTVLRPPGTDYQGNSGAFAVSLRGDVAWAVAPVPGGGSMGSGVGPLYRSLDGGATWTRLAGAAGWGGRVDAGGPGFAGVPSGPSAQAALATFGVAAGAAEGGVGVTVDGGKVWTRLLAYANAAQVTGAAWDGARTIWAAGTTDPWAWALPVPYVDRITVRGGGRFTVRQVMPRPVPLRLANTGPRGLLAGVGLAGDPNAVLMSANGGRTWSVRGTVSANVLAGAQFLTPRAGYAYGIGIAANGSPVDRIWRTGHGAASWLPVSAGIPTYALAMTDGGRGMRVALDQAGGADTVLVQRTRDGGRSWTTRARLPAAPYDAIAAAVTGAGRAYVLIQAPAAGGRATLEATTGSGVTWRELGTFGLSSAAGFTPGVAATGPTCVAVDAGGAVYVRRAAGRTWTRSVPSRRADLVSSVAVAAGCRVLSTFAPGPEVRP